MNNTLAAITTAYDNTGETYFKRATEETTVFTFFGPRRAIRTIVNADNNIVTIETILDSGDHLTRYGKEVDFSTDTAAAAADLENMLTAAKENN